MKQILLMLGIFSGVLFADTPVVLSDATLVQDPKTRVVTVQYRLTGDRNVVRITMDIETNGVSIGCNFLNITGDVSLEENQIISPDPVGYKTIVWDAKKDWPGNLSTNARAKVIAWLDEPVIQNQYAVFDLSGGIEAASFPVRYSSVGPAVSNNQCRTTEMWFRRIPAGTFTMGSPADELFRKTDGTESQHQVTLSKAYYIGLFPCTQYQYRQITGTNLSYSMTGDLLPVNKMQYKFIRAFPGPQNATPGAFVGALRSKTGLSVDLPTEAQWEYAGRAGTTTAWNNGTTITGAVYDANMTLLGSYKNASFTMVGQYLPNAWGLYDFHGGVWEYCLDLYVAQLGTTPVVDPLGNTGSSLVLRGGSKLDQASDCRIARRLNGSTTWFDTYSFRLVFPCR